LSSHSVDPRILLIFPAMSMPVAGSRRRIPTTLIGVAKVDITPRRPSACTLCLPNDGIQGVAGRLKAAALAIGEDAGDGPAVLLSVDSGAVPSEIRSEVLRAFRPKRRLKPERFMLANSHNHSGTGP